MKLDVYLTFILYEEGNSVKESRGQPKNGALKQAIEE